MYGVKVSLQVKKKKDLIIRSENIGYLPFMKHIHKSEVTIYKPVIFCSWENKPNHVKHNTDDNFIHSGDSWTNSVHETEDTQLQCVVFRVMKSFYLYLYLFNAKMVHRVLNEIKPK